MAFNILTNLTGVTPAFEYYPVTSAEAVKLGEALVLSAGKLTKTGLDTDGAYPEFIAMRSITGDGTAQIPVIRITEYIAFETTFAAAGTAINPGDKVTIHTDGAQVTATTAKGVFAVSAKEGTGAIGQHVAGYFRR